VRGIYPTCKLVSAAGIVDVDDKRISGEYAAMIESRGKV
jgi:hypothetical protein